MTKSLQFQTNFDNSAFVKGSASIQEGTNHDLNQSVRYLEELIKIYYDDFGGEGDWNWSLSTEIPLVQFITIYRKSMTKQLN